MTSRYDYVRQASMFTMNGLPNPGFETAHAAVEVPEKHKDDEVRIPFLIRAIHLYRSFREKKEAIQSR